MRCDCTHPLARQSKIEILTIFQEESRYSNQLPLGVKKSATTRPMGYSSRCLDEADLFEFTKSRDKSFRNRQFQALGSADRVHMLANGEYRGKAYRYRGRF